MCFKLTCVAIGISRVSKISSDNKTVELGDLTIDIETATNIATGIRIDFNTNKKDTSEKISIDAETMKIKIEKNHIEKLKPSFNAPISPYHTLALY